MFKDIKLQSTYSTYDNNIAKEFYIPVLAKSICYDRATAYFSSKSLSNYAKGLENFVKRCQTYRLIISTEVSKEDYQEIKKGYSLRESIKKELILRIQEDISLEEEKNLSNLSYLISIGVVDIKMAFTKKGIFHDKFGLMEDEEGNIICFRGSNNETNQAFNANYEAFDVTCSWLASNFDYEKITKSKETFENLWNNNNPQIYVCVMDDVLYKEIDKYNKGCILTEPTFLEKDCLLLDYDGNNLILYIKIEPPKISHFLYHTHLRSIVDIREERKIIFKNDLTYLKFKKVISIFEEDSKKNSYKLLITDRLTKYIDEKDMHLKERKQLGISIKNKNNGVLSKFEHYRKVLNNTMDRQLREKQFWDSFYMYSMKRSCNFSVPGSGKTASVLGVFSYLSDEKKTIKRIVMIGPKNSFGSWIDEFNACFGAKKELVFFNIHDSKYKSKEDKKREIKLDTGNTNLFLFNYESIEPYFNELKTIIDNETLLVFDEVHRIKALNGTYARNAIEMSKTTTHIICLTGTPIPNSYIDIRNILNILYHDEYNDFFGFSDIQLKKPTIDDIENINEKIQPFFCRTNKEQLSVPKVNDDNIVSIETTEIENRLLNILLATYSKNMFVLIIRLLQLESDPKMLLEKIEPKYEFSDVLDILLDTNDIDYIDYSEDIVFLINSINKTTKFESCISLAMDLYSQGKPFVVWCIFRHSIVNIQKELECNGLNVGVIYGDVDMEERNAIIKAFKNGRLDALITNPHTLAESVSLHTNCHDAIYFEYSYNLVHLLQSKDRIHRLGLAENQYTQYYFLQSNFTTRDKNTYSLDAKIYGRLKEKESIMLEAIDNDKLEQLTTAEEDLEIIFKELKL